MRGRHWVQTRAVARTGHWSGSMGTFDELNVEVCGRTRVCRVADVSQTCSLQDVEDVSATVQ